MLIEVVPRSNGMGVYVLQETTLKMFGLVWLTEVSTVWGNGCCLVFGLMFGVKQGETSVLVRLNRGCSLCQAFSAMKCYLFLSSTWSGLDHDGWKVNLDHAVTNSTQIGSNRFGARKIAGRCRKLE